MSKGVYIPQSLATFYHLVIFLVYLFAVTYDELYVRIPGVRDKYGEKFKFLTFWNEIIQAAYFGFCLFNDFCGSNQKPWDDQKKRHKLQNLRDKFFACIAFPLGMFVVLTFWGLYAVDRELVYPRHLDGFIPSWLNHIMHTTVLPFLLIEQMFVYHHYPKRLSGIPVTFAVAATYLVWILWIAYYTNIWVYPVLQVLGIGGKAAFIGGMLGLLAIIYLVGEKINKCLWGTVTEAKTVKIK